MAIPRTGGILGAPGWFLLALPIASCTDATGPVAEDPAEFSLAAFVAAGSEHTCALLEGGEVYC